MDDQPRAAAPLPLPPPPPGPQAPTASDRGALRELARRQRAAVVAGVANAVAGALTYTHAIPAGIGSLFALVVAACVIVAAFRLAQRLQTVGVAIACGIAMLIPVVWIVVLVLLSSKASKQLKAAGVTVGVFGASPSSV
jgi:hypothetical protein